MENTYMDQTEYTWETDVMMEKPKPKIKLGLSLIGLKGQKKNTPYSQIDSDDQTHVLVISPPHKYIYLCHVNIVHMIKSWTFGDVWGHLVRPITQKGQVYTYYCYLSH